MIRGLLYRLSMKIIHKFDLHYMPPTYPEGDTQLWCKWCGARYTKYRITGKMPMLDIRIED